MPRRITTWGMPCSSSAGMMKRSPVIAGQSNCGRITPRHGVIWLPFQSQGRDHEAVACFERALALKPDYAEGHYNFGNALASQGKLDAAVGEFRRALELKPDYVDAWNNLGNALKELEQLDAAISSWRRALELRPIMGLPTTIWPLPCENRDTRKTRSPAASGRSN